MYFGQPYHLPPPSLHYNNSDMEYRFMLKKDMEYRLPQCDGQLLGQA